MVTKLSGQIVATSHDRLDPPNGGDCKGSHRVVTISVDGVGSFQDHKVITTLHLS